MTRLKPSSLPRGFTCIYCSGKLRLNQGARIPQDFEGELLVVRSPAYVCVKCRRQFLKEPQGDQLRRNTTKAYREKLHLLTGAQIRNCRKALGLTRAEFAAVMEVYEKTVDRWERWLIQDSDTDQRIRQTCASYTSAEKYERLLSGLMSRREFCAHIGFPDHANYLMEVLWRLQSAHRRLIRRAMRRDAAVDAIIELRSAEGGSWSLVDLRNKFGFRAVHLCRRRRQQKIIFWQDDHGAFFYPVWQFRPNGTLLPGVREVLKIFRSQDRWRIVRYFLTCRRQLGHRRPLALLRAGEMKAVIAHAQLHAAENTW